MESHITTEELISLIEEEFDVSGEGEYLLDMTDNRTCSENVAAYIRQHKKYLGSTRVYLALKNDNSGDPSDPNVPMNSDPKPFSSNDKVTEKSDNCDDDPFAPKDSVIPKPSTSNDKVDQKSDSRDDDPFAPKDSVNSKPSTSNDKGAQKSDNRDDDPFASKGSIYPKHSTSNDKVTQKSDNRDNDPFPPKDCIKPEPSAPNDKVALARDNNDYDPSAPKTSTLNYKAIEILSYDDIISKEMAVKEVLEEQDSHCNRSDTTLEPDELEAVDTNEYVPVYARNVALQLFIDIHNKPFKRIQGSGYGEFIIVPKSDMIPFEDFKKNMPKSEALVLATTALKYFLFHVINSATVSVTEITPNVWLLPHDLAEAFTDWKKQISSA